MNLPPELTDDTLFNGSLTCRQYKKGYRFSVDSVLAAHFSAPGQGDRILDLGCGCGIIGLILAHRHPAVRVTGLEIQPELAELARDNILANDFTDRLAVLEGDLCAVRKIVPPESFDLVVSNPPYRAPGSGRLSRGGQRARARHEIDAGIGDIARAAAYAVTNRGRVIVIYPAPRLATLVAALKSERLEPKRVQPVYGYPGAAEAVLVMIEAVKNGGEGTALLEPIYIYACANGPLSKAMQKMYG